MSKKYRKRVVLATVETVEGQDANPTGAANAMLCSEPTITPLAGGTVQRNLVRQSLGADPAIHVGTHVQITFRVEIAGAGAVDTPPPYGPLLRMCGMAETITPTTGPVEYDPVSDSEESGTLYFNLDGSLHPLLGARGNVSLVYPANDIPRYEFALTGLWADPSEAAAPTPVFTAFQDPLPVSKVNTPTFNVHGFAGVLEELTLDLGNQVVHRDRPGSERVLRTDRRGAGNVRFEAPALSAKNFFTTAKANTLGALQIIHGTVVGNIVQVDAPKAQILEPTYEEADGVALISAQLLLAPDAGDDEIKITVK